MENKEIVKSGLQVPKKDIAKAGFVECLENRMKMNVGKMQMEMNVNEQCEEMKCMNAGPAVEVLPK